MATYRFKKDVGKHRMGVKNGEKVEHRLVKAGEIVELTDEQYAACKDKFEPTDQLHGPSSTELRAMADEKEKQEKAAAKAKADAEKAAKAEAAKAEAAKAAKAGTDQKG